jgi:hypothetical protein
VVNRWHAEPLKKLFSLKKRIELAVTGASFASISMTISPQLVVRVHKYFPESVSTGGGVSHCFGLDAGVGIGSHCETYVEDGVGLAWTSLGDDWLNAYIKTIKRTEIKKTAEMTFRLNLRDPDFLFANWRSRFFCANSRSRRFDEATASSLG